MVLVLAAGDIKLIVELNLIFVYLNFKTDLFFNFLGKYVYIETSRPGSTGHKAFLMSPMFDTSRADGECFTFWYHMFGSGIGTLQIYVDSAIAGKKLLWSLAGDKGNRWYKGQMNVGATNGSYQVLQYFFYENLYHVN